MISVQTHYHHFPIPGNTYFRILANGPNPSPNKPGHKFLKNELNFMKESGAISEVWIKEF